MVPFEQFIVDNQKSARNTYEKVVEVGMRCQNFLPKLKDVLNELGIEDTEKYEDAYMFLTQDDFLNILATLGNIWFYDHKDKTINIGRVNYKEGKVIGFDLLASRALKEIVEAPDNSYSPLNFMDPLVVHPKEGLYFETVDNYGKIFERSCIVNIAAINEMYRDKVFDDPETGIPFPVEEEEESN